MGVKSPKVLFSFIQGIIFFTSMHAFIFMFALHSPFVHLGWAHSRLEHCWSTASPGYHRLVHAHPGTADTIPPGMGWRPMDSQCQLDELLSNQAIEGIMKDKRKGGVLFFGDSIDSYNMYELCDHLNASKEYWWPGIRDGQEGEGNCKGCKYFHSYDSLNFCMAPSGFLVGNYFICGSQLSGPYRQGQTLTPFQRIEWSLRNWTEVGGGLTTVKEQRKEPISPPWLIVFSSNLWDLAGAHERNDREAFLPNRVLSNTFLDSLFENYTKIVLKMKEVYPDSAIVWKTTALPVHSLSAKHEAHRIGDRHETAFITFYHSVAAIKQVNAVGRAVAKKLGLLVLDAEDMASWLTPNMYLRDLSHPNQRFALDVGNLMLNILRDVLNLKG